jgi:hypothetical protein
MIPLVLCPNIRTPAERRQLAVRGASLRERLAAAGPDRCELVVETKTTKGSPWHSLILRIIHEPHVGASVAHLSDDVNPKPEPSFRRQIHETVLAILSRAGRDDARIRTYRRRAERLLDIAMHAHVIEHGEQPFYSTYTADGLVWPHSLRITRQGGGHENVAVPDLPAGHLPPVHRLWMYDDDRAVIADHWFHLQPGKISRHGDPVAMLRLTAEMHDEGPLAPLRARSPSLT